MTNKTKTNQSKNLYPTFRGNKIVWFFGLFIIILSIFIILNNEKNSVDSSLYDKSLPTSTPTPLLTNDKGNGFKEYKSNQYGFSIDIPQNYSIEQKNVTRSNLSPIETEIDVKDFYGNTEVYLSVIKYSDGDNFYDLISDTKNNPEYSEPQEIMINNAKGVYSKRKTIDGFDSLLYLVPLDRNSYIRMSYSAPKNDIDNNLPNLYQEKIIKSFKFL